MPSAFFLLGVINGLKLELLRIFILGRFFVIKRVIQNVQPAEYFHLHFKIFFYSQVQSKLVSITPGSQMLPDTCSRPHSITTNAVAVIDLFFWLICKPVLVVNN